MPPLTGNPSLYPASSFAQSLSGTCLCASIRVTITDNELFTRRRGHIWHCSNCRKVSGSYCSINLILPESSVTITDRDGTLKEFVDRETMSGKNAVRSFCGTCWNPIKFVAEMRPGLVIVKMGLFPRIPAPEFETFVEHRHEWQGQHEGTTRYKVTLGGETV